MHTIVKMRILRHYNITENKKFIFILNFFTLTLLTWIGYLHSDMLIFGKHLGNEYKVQGKSFENFNRLLAKHETQKELKYPHLHNKLSDDVNNRNLKYRMNKLSTYDQLNKKSLNDLDAYKKGYKKRYSTKTGLAKLDCCYERKLFDKIDKIYELSRSMKNDKKTFKKKMYSKFGYPLILFTLSPVLGIIFPAFLFENGPLSNVCFNECTKDDHKHNEQNSTFYRSQFSRAQWETFFYIHMVYYIILCITVLTVIIYTLVKVVKYERLKAGKGKMKMNEYYRFCKNIFI